MIDAIDALHKEKFEQWLLFGQHVLFTDIRISNDIIPKNIYKYELQESDCHPFETIMIGKHITVNFEGTYEFSCTGKSRPGARTSRARAARHPSPARSRVSTRYRGR